MLLLQKGKTVVAALAVRLLVFVVFLLVRRPLPLKCLLAVAEPLNLQEAAKKEQRLKPPLFGPLVRLYWPAYRVVLRQQDPLAFAHKELTGAVVAGHITPCLTGLLLVAVRRVWRKLGPPVFLFTLGGLVHRPILLAKLAALCPLVVYVLVGLFVAVRL